MASLGLIDRIGLEHPRALLLRVFDRRGEQPMLQAMASVRPGHELQTTDQTGVSSTGFMTGERRNFR